MTTPLLTFRGHRAGVNTLLCQEDKHANVLVSGSDDGSCRLWDVRTTRATRCLNVKKALGGQPSDDTDDYAVNSLAFSRTTESLLYVASGNKILTFDLRQEGLILDCSSKEVLQDNEDEINTLAVHPSKQARYLSAPDDNGDIRIYDLQSHKLHKTLRAQHTNICMCAPFRPNAAWDLVSGGMDGLLLFWDFSRGRLKFKIDLNAGMNSLDAASAGPESTQNQMFNPPLVHAIDFAPNGKSFAAGLGDATVAVVDFASRQIVRRMTNHQAIVSQVHFPAFRQNEWLLSSGNDSKITVWDYAQALGDEATAELVVKDFQVRDKPNAITTCLHQNLVLVSDVGNEIAAYPLQ